MKRLVGLLGLLAFASLALIALHDTGTPPAFAQAGKFGEKDKDKQPEKKEAEDTEAKGPFKHLKYRLIGPAAGGRVSRSCGVVGDPSTYYVGAAAGGVWKTTDGGLSWKPIFDDQPTASIGAVAVAPSDPNVVYVGSGEANIRGNVMPGNGIYRSRDAGKTWKHVWKQKGQVSHIIVHPKNADVAYAAVLGSAFGPNPERGVYRTTDGGKTWQPVLQHVITTMKKEDALGPGPKGGEASAYRLFPGPKEPIGAIDVCFDPGNPRILFAALWQTRRTPWSLTSGGAGSGLYRSDDAGDTWKKIGPDAKGKDDDEDTGLPEGPWGRVGVAVAPSDSKRVYALIEAENGGLYRSDDGGESWKLVDGARYLRQRPWYFSTVHVDPSNADIVYCPNVRLLRSADGGKTFRNTVGPHHPDHHDLWIDPKNPKRMIDSNDGGVDITSNGGKTWLAPPLPIAQFYHISVDTSVPYRVMGPMQDQGTASGPSNSLSAAGISLSDWHSVGGGETGFAVPDPSDPNIVYAGEYGGYISRYDNRTRQATNVGIYPVDPSGKGAGELKYRFQWTAPIVISPHDPKTIYHAANVLFRTTDAGKSWMKISPDLTRDDKSKEKWSGGPITGDNTGAEYYCTVFAVAESPKKAGVLWTGSDDGLVHVSLDAGKTWDNVTKKIPGIPEWATVGCVETSPHDAATAYVVADAHRLDDNTPYLWKTTDYGKTWASLAGGLPKGDYLRVVREDPKVPGLLYAGSEHRVSLSRDGGKTWTRLKLNMPTAAVCDLVVKDNDLVVGTSGRSIWILDDITPIRAWSGKIEKGGPHLFPVQPAVRWRYHGENYAGEDRIPGDNPPKGAVINYYLDRKPKDDLVLEILDGDGKVLRKLTSKKAEEPDEEAPDRPWDLHKITVLPSDRGLQRVTWNLKHEGPTVIPGAKNDAGVPHEGPLVLPGTYTVKLHVDGKVLTGSVAVRLDPRGLPPETDLKERDRIALQVRDDISRLSETVIALRSVRGQITQRVAALKDNAKGEGWAKEAKEVLEKLDVLEKKLHNPEAEVTYDILAKKGGAKLYSQQALLYGFLREGDAPVPQGIREVRAEQAKELNRLEAEWRDLLNSDLTRLNANSSIPAIVVPVPAKR